MSTGETVEKVRKQILGRDAEKNDFTECATINDLTIMKGRETPKNQALTILKGFSTVSEELFGDKIFKLKTQNTLQPVAYLSLFGVMKPIIVLPPNLGGDL